MDLVRSGVASKRADPSVDDNDDQREGLDKVYRREIAGSLGSYNVIANRITNQCSKSLPHYLRTDLAKSKYSPPPKTDSVYSGPRD